MKIKNGNNFRPLTQKHIDLAEKEFKILQLEGPVCIDLMEWSEYSVSEIINYDKFSKEELDSVDTTGDYECLKAFLGIDLNADYTWYVEHNGHVPHPRNHDIFNVAEIEADGISFKSKDGSCSVYWSCEAKLSNDNDVMVELPSSKKLLLDAMGLAGSSIKRNIFTCKTGKALLGIITFVIQ